MRHWWTQLSDEFGYPQFAALFILLQRGIEELHSLRDTQRLPLRGTVEAGREYYSVVATAHAAWIASLALSYKVQLSLKLCPCASMGQGSRDQ